MQVEFNGNQIDFELSRTDFATQFGTDSLVWFSSGEADKVIVDKQASDSYAKYAAIHECICQGRCKHLAPKVANPNLRCGEIDKMILVAMPESERRQYLEKRIEMFETLLDKHLNQPMEPLFRESLKTLRSLYGIPYERR